MPPKGYYQNFVSFIYLCYDNILDSYSLETNTTPAAGGSGRFSSAFMFELQARHGCYDMGHFMNRIKNDKILSNLPADVFARWINANHEYLTHLPKTIWE